MRLQLSFILYLQQNRDLQQGIVVSGNQEEITTPTYHSNNPPQMPPPPKFPSNNQPPPQQQPPAQSSNQAPVPAPRYVDNYYKYIPLLGFLYLNLNIFRANFK